jgi:hypothetical protein
MRIPRPQLSYSNVIATIALFVALGGAAVAAGLPKKSVGAKQLKPGAVTKKALHRKAVTSGKIAPQAVTAGKLGPFAVLPGNLGNGIITTEKLGDGSVIASKIKNGVVTTSKLSNDAVTTNKLNNGAVTSAKLDDGAVNANKLSDGSVTAAKLNPALPGQLQTKAASGATFRGVFDIGAVAASSGDTARGAISLPYSVPPPIAMGVTVVDPGAAPVPNCPGLGAEEDMPQANPSKLCIYLTKAVNLDNENQALAIENLSRNGTGLVAKAKDPGEFYAYGQWAYTAP